MEGGRGEEEKHETGPSPEKTAKLLSWYTVTGTRGLEHKIFAIGWGGGGLSLACDLSQSNSPQGID